VIRYVVTVLMVASLLTAPVAAQEGGTTTGTGQTTPAVQPSQPAPGGTTTATGGGGHAGVSQPQPVSTAGKTQKVESGKKAGEAKKKKGKKKTEKKRTQKAGLQGLTRSLRELRYYALATAVGLAIMAVMMGYGLVKFERRLSQRSMKAKARKAKEARKKPPKVERKLRKTEPEEEEVERVRKLWKQVKEGD